MTWDHPAMDFYRQMGPHLAANLLTVMFVWALVSYTRLEKERREKRDGGGHIGTMLLVFLMLGGSMMASGFFDGILSRFN